jgi:hypothetical protein
MLHPEIGAFLRLYISTSSYYVPFNVPSPDDLTILHLCIKCPFQTKALQHPLPTPPKKVDKQPEHQPMNPCIPNSPPNERPFVALLLASQSPISFNKAMAPQLPEKPGFERLDRLGHESIIAGRVRAGRNRLASLSIEPLQQYLIG